MKGKMGRLLPLGALLAILGACLLPLVVYADLTAPDTTEVEDVQVWKHMKQPDDVLVVVRFNATYGNISDRPSQPISETFYFTYGNSTGTILGNETAYPFWNMGYVKGLVAFYWDNDDPNKPTWGDLGNVTMQGTALFGGSPPSDTWTLTADDWTTGTQPSTMRESLRQWLLNQLIFLEMNWNDQAVDQGYTDKQISLTATLGGEYYVASTSGQAYLGLTIDGITGIVPLLFMTQTTEITHTERDWTLAQQSAFESIHTTDVIGNGTAALGELIGVSPIWAATLAMLMACLGVVAVCQIAWGRLNNGLLIAYAMIIIATPEGLFQMGLMALFAMVGILYIADIFLPKRHA